MTPIATDFKPKKAINLIKSSLLVQEQDFFKLILVYRWLSLLPPGIALVIMPKLTVIALAFFGLAIFYLLWQTQRWGVAKTNLTSPGYFKISLDLVFCIVLMAANGIWSSPYYLYVIGLIFEAAYFYGLLPAIRVGLVLASSYLLALINSLLTTGQGGNWVLSVTNLSGFVLYSLLFGYQSSISRQLKEKTMLAEAYRQTTEQQNSQLLQINHDLEETRRFSEIIQTQTDIQAVYRMAVCQLLTFEAIEKAALGIIVQGKVVEWLNCSKNSEIINYQTNLLEIVSFNEISRAISRKNEIIITTQDKQLIGVPAENEVIAVLLITARYPQPLAILPLLADQLGRTIANLERVQKLTIEAERARLAMDMHDAVAQSLFGLAYSLDACVKLLPTQPNLIQQKLMDLRDSAFSTLSNLRNIIYDLWDREEENQTEYQSEPPEHYLTLPELSQLIRRHLKNVNTLYSFPILLEVATADLRISSAQAKALYRVMQEALANASKHAAPTEVKISLQVDKNAQTLQLIVKDNGCGFDLEATLPLHHLGLTTMQKRIEAVGGSFQLWSKIANGTSIELTMPLAN